MNLLAPDQQRAARQHARNLKSGDAARQSDIDALSAEWEPKVQPPEKARTERFAVASPDGSTTGITGPRWLFHLFGIRHRAAEIAFATPSGLIVLQRRSPTKDQWPDALDMAVAGHIPQRQDDSDMSFEEGAWKEIAEEIGLPQADASRVIVEGCLTKVGDPYYCFEGDPQHNPPFLDAEVRQIFAATLTGEGLARLNFTDNEVAGIYLTTVELAWQILREENIASGLRYSLPRYLDWLERNGRR